MDNVRHCRYCVSHHASREFQYSCFILLCKLGRFLLWVLYFVASCVTWVTLLYSDSCVTWHLTLYLNLYNVRILLCHVRCSVQGNVQCRVPRKINKKNNVLYFYIILKLSLSVASHWQLAIKVESIKWKSWHGYIWSWNISYCIVKFKFKWKTFPRKRENKKYSR